MFTFTTYGTWLRGDARGWIDDGKLMSPDPVLETADWQRMKYPAYYFPCQRLHDIGTFLGEGLIQELNQRVYALMVQSWHIHVVVGNTRVHYADIAKCAKDKVRYGLRIGRPIWGADYDKRFCFDERALMNRIRYVERHNERDGLPARPWSFIMNSPISHSISPAVGDGGDDRKPPVADRGRNS
jgi:hypothetical protein